MTKTVLLIDDFDNTLFVTGLTLENAGYKTIKATSANDAIKILKSDVAVHLVISDYHMPGMNGVEFITELRKMPGRQNIPAFILSTETKDEVKKSALYAGATAWIQKPFKSEKLVEHVKRTIN